MTVKAERARARRLMLLPLAVMVPAAGCGAAAPPSSPSPPPPAVTWQRFAAQCPTLVDPPYGLAAKGKPFAAGAVDSAERLEARCDYAAPGGQPLLTLHVSIDRAADGTARTEQDYLTERSAAAALPGFDVADVSGLGDAAFATYDQGTWSVLAKARTGNAVVVAQLLAGRDVAESWDVSAPLQQQMPALSGAMRDFLTGLG